jgi:hypothetical protein
MPMNHTFWLKLLVVLPATTLLAALARAESTESPGPSGSETLLVNYVSVKGDAQKFREDWWMKDQWSGGVEQFTLDQDLDPHTVLHVEGRGVFEEDDYRLRLGVTRFSVGFIRAGYTQNRTYYDDWGGFYRPFTPPAFRLGRDLHLDDSDIFVDLGLTLPDLPQLTLGYERQFRNGTKSLLEWGSVQQGATERKIFPSFKDIDETVDILKLNLDHHVGIVSVANRLRFEHYRADDNTFDKGSTNLTTGANQDVTIHEESRYDLLSNVFHMDSRANDKVYWSASYLYSRMDGDAGLQLDTTPFATVSPTADSVKDWFTHSVNLDQDSHVANVNALIGPFKQLSFYGGAQAERTRGSGNAEADLLQLLGSFTNSPLALIRSDTDKESLQETLGARFTGIPHTTVYADGQWREVQYSLSQFETDDSVTNVFRNTDTDVFRQQYTVGFHSSPFRRVTLSAHYRRIMEANHYDNTANISPGYPGFITEQDFTTDQIVAKLVVRPTAKLTTAFQYKLASTDIRTANKSIVFSGSTLVLAGSELSGNYDANTYSVNATLTPLSRLYLTSSFSFQDTRTVAFANNASSVQPYRGNVYTVFGAAGYALEAKTDVTIDYTFSRSENSQENSASALPLGLNNQRHALTAGLTRRIRKNIIARVRYGFYEYDESSNGGINNYRAHLASASCTLAF